MSLTTYNFFWGMVKFILPSYLERRQKKGKEDIHRINERFGISKNNPVPISFVSFGSMLTFPLGKYALISIPALDDVS